MACHQPIFSIYWCVRSSLLSCAGAQITRFRRGCIWKIFCGGAYLFSSLNNPHWDLGTSHTKLVVSVSVWYACVLRFVHSKICSRWLMDIIYTYSWGLPTSSSMLPARNFEIMWHVRPQSTPGPATDITSTRQSERQHAQPRQNRTTVVWHEMRSSIYNHAVILAPECACQGDAFLISRKVDALPQGLRGRPPYIKTKTKLPEPSSPPIKKRKPHFTSKTPPGPSRPPIKKKTRFTPKHYPKMIYVCRKWVVAV